MIGHGAAVETGLGPILFSYTNTFIPVSSPPLGEEDSDIVTLLVVADVTVDNLPAASAGAFYVPTESRAVYDRRSGEFLSITSRPLPRKPGEASGCDGRGSEDMYQLQWEYYQLGDCRACRPTSSRCRSTVTSLLCSPSGWPGGGGNGSSPSTSGSAEGARSSLSASSPVAEGASSFALLSRMDCLLQPAAPPPAIPNSTPPLCTSAVATASHGVSAVAALTHSLRGLFGVAIGPALSWVEAFGPLPKLPPSMSLVQEYAPAGPSASVRLRTLAARLFLPPRAFRPLGLDRDHAGGGGLKLGQIFGGRVGVGVVVGVDGSGGSGGGDDFDGFDADDAADTGMGTRRHVRVRRRKLDLKDVETDKEKERILRNRAAAMRSNAKRRDARIAKAAAKMAAAAREGGGGVGGGRDPKRRG